MCVRLSQSLPPPPNGEKRWSVGSAGNHLTATAANNLNTTTPTTATPTSTILNSPLSSILESSASETVIPLEQILSCRCDELVFFLPSLSISSLVLFDLVVFATRTYTHTQVYKTSPPVQLKEPHPPSPPSHSPPLRNLWSSKQVVVFTLLILNR